MAEVAIVILNYNGKSHLEHHLPSVTKHSQGHDIIIADNASTDDSVNFVNRKYPRVRIIEIEKNLGYAGGYQYALSLIKAKYYILLNSDVEVTPNWVMPVIKMMNENSAIVAAQPKILSYLQPDYFEYAGAAGGFIDYLGYPFCRGRIFDTIEKDYGQFDDNKRVFWSSGACLFVRAEVFHQLGGLDDTFFAHMEEIDLCWRINKSGNQVMYCSESTVYHVGGGTLDKSNPRKTYLNFRNSLMMLYKNYSTKQLFTLLPLRIFLDFVASLHFALSGNFNNAVAVSKAILYFLLNIRIIQKKRTKVRNMVKNPISDSLIYPKSIVFSYFVRKKKEYKSLLHL